MLWGKTLMMLVGYVWQNTELSTLMLTAGEFQISQQWNDTPVDGPIALDGTGSAMTTTETLSRPHGRIGVHSPTTTCLLVWIGRLTRGHWQSPFGWWKSSNTMEAFVLILVGGAEQVSWWEMRWERVGQLWGANEFWNWRWACCIRVKQGIQLWSVQVYIH